MKKREMKILGIGMVLGIIVVGALIAQTPNSNPKLIPFQARLTDASGAPYADGTYDLVFRLYLLSDGGGGPIWQESHSQVPLRGGMFNVMLGSKNSLAAVDFAAPRYVGISVNGAAEMVPLHQILPAVYAHDSGLLNGLPAGNASGEVPINDGNLNINLNADRLDGRHAGHADGEIPISDGTLNQNLYAARAADFDEPGMIAMFDKECPSGWDEYQALRNRYPRGEPNGNWNDLETGGSYSHRHWLTSWTSGDPDQTWGADAGSDIQVGSRQHWHTVPAKWGQYADAVPPYKDLIFCKKQ